MISIPKSHSTSVISRTPSFIKHLKQTQFFSLMPLSLSSTSFSELSSMYIFGTVIIFISQLVHNWVPELALQYKASGPFSAALFFLEKILYCATPVIFLTTTIRNRLKFERSTKQLLSVLKMLGLWTYPMYLSCKVSIFLYGIGFGGFVVRYLVSFFSGTAEILPFIDDLLWQITTIYMCGWVFQFLYTVRTIQECYVRLSQTFVGDELSTFFQIFHRLIDIAVDTNEFYDFPVSLMLLLLLLAFVDYTTLAFAEDQISLVDQMYMYVWISVLIGIIICILRGCHSASAQANDCDERLLKHLVHATKPAYQEHPLLVIHLCARKSLVFRAFKSFTINYTLGISMIAAYFTYVIVLFQVDHASKKSRSFALDSNNSAVPNTGNK